MHVFEIEHMKAKALSAVKQTNSCCQAKLAVSSKVSKLHVDL